MRVLTSMKTLRQFVRFNRFKWLHSYHVEHLPIVQLKRDTAGASEELEKRRKNAVKCPSTISSLSIRRFTVFRFLRWSDNRKRKLNGGFIFGFLFSVCSSHGGAKTFNTNKNANLYMYVFAVAAATAATFPVV